MRIDKEIRIYLVGGTVRDYLLGRPTKDFDFVVCGLPPQRLAATLVDLGMVDFVGRRFGVYKFKPKNSTIVFDIALPRTEQSRTHQGKHTDFEIVADYRLPIEHDLVRRDFTINAMAYDWIANKLIDPTGGAGDLKRKKITTVGVPAQRFTEDYIRMLRAVRCAAELDFAIAPATLRTIKQLAPKLHQPQVPREPIAIELSRALATNPVSTTRLLEQSGLRQALLPEVRPPAIRWALAAMEKNPNTSYAVRLALLFYSLPTSLIGTVARRLSLSAGLPSIDVRQLIWLVGEAKKILTTPQAWSSVYLEHAFFSPKTPGDDLLQLCTIAAQDQRSRTTLVSLRQALKKIAPRQTLPRPLLTGTDLIKLGVPAGKRIAELLLHVREAQLDQKLKTQKEAIALVKKLR